MRPILLALMILMSAAAHPSGGNDGTAGLTIGGEYRYDALEYSGEKKHFVRDMAALDLSGKTSIAFSHLYVQESDLHRWTWNFNSAGLIPGGEIYAGHYYLSFGTGLVMGMNDGRESDPFSLRKIAAGRDFYRPCLTGNPSSAFYGGLAKYSREIAGINISCAPFFSYRERYITYDYRDKDPVRYRTLAGHLDRKNVRYEPVYLSDAGIFGSAALKNFFIQAYFIYSGTQNEDRRPVPIAPSEGPLNEIIRYYALGVFAQYRDDYIRIYAEIDAPFADSTGKTKAGSPAVVAGAKITHRSLDVFFNTTWCGTSYFSLHGSPSIATGTTWQCGFTVRPARGFSAGFSCSSEKENRPGRGERLPRSVRREQVFCGWKRNRKAELSLRGGRVEEDGTGQEKKLQAKIGLKFTVNDVFSFTVSGVYQSRGGEHSGSCPVKLDFSERRIFRASVYYSPYFIDGKNLVYARVLPVRDAVSPGLFIRDDSHIAAVQAGVSYRSLKISARYQVQFVENRVVSHQAEARAENTF